MKVFIWDGVKVSGNYHSSGGIVIFASDEKRARELAHLEEDVKIDPNDQPIYTANSSGEEKVFIFPDAGCC